MKLNILGTEYIVITKDLKDSDGKCDTLRKRILIHTMAEYTKKQRPIRRKQVLRHEIVHAFLAESGLQADTFEAGAWATNEEMVDWIARQGPKLFQAFREADAM